MINPMFSFSRAIESKFPELSKFDKPGISAAIEDLYTSQKELKRILSELGRLRNGDYKKLTQLLTDLDGLFEHSAGHIGEGRAQLVRLLTTAYKMEDEKSKGGK